VDRKIVSALLERAEIDLETAERNLDPDPECAYTYSYTAMLRCGQALMFTRGFQPDVKDKHRTIVRFAGIALGPKHDDLVNDFDLMRRKRNRLIYEPSAPCSRSEATHALSTAKRFLRETRKVVC
jgi:uncharacterized protein (UPF0332 family)